MLVEHNDNIKAKHLNSGVDLLNLIPNYENILKETFLRNDLMMRNSYYVL